MQPCRIIYYSLAALHISSDIFAHHQEHITVSQLLVLHTYVAAGWYHGSVGTKFQHWYYGSAGTKFQHWYYGSAGTKFQHSHNTSRQRNMCVIPGAVIQFRCS